MSTVTPKQKQSLLRKLNAIKGKIGRERDKLRKLVAEYEEILDDCENAQHELESAIDTLSQHL